MYCISPFTGQLIEGRIERMEEGMLRTNLSMNEYQTFAMETAIYPRNIIIPGNIDIPIYPALKLAGEAGEIAEKWGKAMRDGIGDKIEWKKDIVKELGDVLWYVAAIANDIGYSLGDVGRMNIEKLRSRQERGKLGGSGDNR